MSSKTKIVVLRMKEIIYTAIFIGLAIFLILLFFFMFRSEKEAPAPTAESVSPAVYAPGVYSASLSLGRQNVNVEVAVSPDRISAVTLVPLSDSVAAMYPLMQPSMDALSAQILESQSLEGLEAHIQNRLRLNLCQSKPRNQLFLRFLRTFAFANQRDHFIQMIDRNH